MKLPEVLTATPILAIGILVQALGISGMQGGVVLTGTAIITLAGIAWGHSLNSDASDRAKLVSLHVASGFLALFALAAIFYIMWGDSGDKPAPTYEFISVDEDVAMLLRPSSYPGGTARPDVTPLVAGHPIMISCREDDEFGGIWLRLPEYGPAAGYWIPADLVRPLGEVDAVDVPLCRD